MARLSDIGHSMEHTPTRALQLNNSIFADLPLAERNVEMLSTSGQPPPHTPDWVWQTDHPYVHGVFAPVDSELELTELSVDGELPADLQGCYVINSPNQRWKPQGKYHYYDGGRHVACRLFS